MTSGVAIYGRSYFGRLGKAEFRSAMATDDHLLYYKDGLSATVSRSPAGELLYMRVNGKTDASNAGDMHTQTRCRGTSPCSSGRTPSARW